MPVLVLRTCQHRHARFVLEGRCVCGAFVPRTVLYAVYTLPFTLLRIAVFDACVAVAAFCLLRLLYVTFLPARLKRLNTTREFIYVFAVMYIPFPIYLCVSPYYSVTKT